MEDFNSLADMNAADLGLELDSAAADLKDLGVDNAQIVAADLESQARLVIESNLDVMADESFHTRESLAQLIERRASRKYILSDGTKLHKHQLERHLSQEDFFAAFHLTRGEFGKLANMRKKRLRILAGLG